MAGLKGFSSVKREHTLHLRERCFSGSQFDSLSVRGHGSVRRRVGRDGCDDIGVEPDVGIFVFEARVGESLPGAVGAREKLRQI
jgi:hypothetical protein